MKILYIPLNTVMKFLTGHHSVLKYTEFMYQKKYEGSFQGDTR